MRNAAQTKLLKAALYCRVSTDDQTKIASIKAQEDYLTSWAEKEGLDVHKIYRDDGYSGKDMKRPALKQMIEDAKMHKFEVVLIYHNDRLSRNTKDVLEIAHELQVLRIALRFGNLDIDTTTPEGEMLFTMMGAFSQYFRRDLGRKTSLGMQKRKRDGLWMGRPGKYFEIIENGQLKVKDPEVFEIERLHDKEQLSFEKIAERLEEHRNNVWRAYRTLKWLRGQGRLSQEKVAA